MFETDYNMANTLFVGQVYHQFDELPSTNDYIRNLVHDPLVPEGFSVRTNYQTAGRGQMAARWLSAPGENILLSVLLRPTWLPAADHWWLYPAIALGVSSAISSQIKWPNDLYFQQKKTGGILIQNILAGEQLNASIVGIGLNVNQLHFENKVPNATSIRLHTGQTRDLETLTQILFEHLERYYLLLRAGQRQALLEQYYERLLGYRQEMSFCRTADGLHFKGCIDGVAADGRLRVVTEWGEWLFGLKEVQFLWD